MMKDNTKIQRFEVDHRHLFRISLLCGSYIPGTDDYLKSKHMRKFVHFLGSVPIFCAILSCSTLIWHIITHSDYNKVYLIFLIRRAIIIIFMSLRIGFHITRYKQLDRIYQQWNEEFNTDYMAAGRKVLHEQHIKSATLVIGIFIAFKFSMAQLYNIPFILHRHARSSNLVGLPHDVESPYHFVHVIFQVIYFAWIGAVLIPIEFYVVYSMIIAQNELELLRGKLAEIMSTLDINDKFELVCKTGKGHTPIEFQGKEYYEKAKYVDVELKKWTIRHLKTIKWINDIRDYLQWDITLKYVYLGIHCSLVVIGLVGAKSSDMMNDLILTVLTTVGNFATLFIGTRNCDGLVEKYSRVFQEAFGSSWYLYPISIQKTMRVISEFHAHNEFKISVMKIYCDNSIHMKAVLQVAYQALTVILPMTAEN